MDPTSRRGRIARRLRGKGNAPGYLLLLPSFLLLALVIGVPTVDAFIISVKRVSLLGGTEPFAGITNYTSVVQNAQFWRVVRTTVIWTTANVGAQMVVGTCLAVWLNSTRRVDRVLRSISLLPWAVPSVVAATAWRFLYDPSDGFIDKVLLHLHLISQPVVWLGQLDTALPSVIVESIWKGTPFVMVIVLAGLQTVPAELYEAATLDGANAFQRLVKVVLPSIRTTIALATLLTIAYSVNNFNAIWLMTRGGPLETTQILFTWGYEIGFVDFNLGQAAALSVMLFFILLVVAVVYFLVRERAGAES
jgi:multiple sugar transport system permease protein